MSATVGFSLPSAYLLGNYSDPSADRIQTALGDVGDGLICLKEHGVASIEIRPLYDGLSSQDLMGLCHEIWDVGLSLTLHGYLPEDPGRGSIAERYPCLQDFVRECPGTDTIITVHSYTIETGTPRDAIEMNVEFLKYLCEDIESHGGGFKVATEINRAKGVIDASNYYDLLVEIYERVEHERLGFCWDFGHAYKNFTLNEVPEYPPISFSRRVIHTHIHDLSVSGVTHWPLTERCLPCGGYVGELLKHGYSGVLNLELEPRRWAEDDDFRSGILDSIDILQGMMA